MFDMSCVKFKDTPFHPNKSNFESTNPKYKELCYNKEKSHRFHIFELFIRDNAEQQSRSYRGKPDDFFTSVGNKLRIARAEEVISERVSTRGNGAAKRTRGVFESEVPPLERRLAPRLGRAAS